MNHPQVNCHLAIIVGWINQISTNDIVSPLKSFNMQYGSTIGSISVTRRRSGSEYYSDTWLWPHNFWPLMICYRSFSASFPCHTRSTMNDFSCRKYRTVYFPTNRSRITLGSGARLTGSPSSGKLAKFSMPSNNSAAIRLAAWGFLISTNARSRSRSWIASIAYLILMPLEGIWVTRFPRI